MEEKARYSRGHSKGSDPPSNPVKKRRIVESNLSSFLEVEGAPAPSPSASQYRGQISQIQPQPVSKSSVRPSPYENCDPTTSEAPASQKPTASAVKRKQDPVERRKQMAKSTEGHDCASNRPQADNERDCRLRESSSSHSQRQVVGQEHAVFAETGSSAGHIHDSSYDNATDLSESIHAAHTLVKPLAANRDGKFKDESNRRHLVDNNAEHHSGNRPGYADAKMPALQDSGDLVGSREASVYPLNDQVAFMGQQSDSETAILRLQTALSLLHSLRNNQGHQLSHNHQEETRSRADSYYSRASSALPSMFPTGGDEASRLISGAAALRTNAGFQPSSGASAPLYSNISSQQIRQPVSTSIAPSLREALQVNQHYQDIETEKAILLARISQSQPRNPQSHAYDRLREGTYGGDQPYPTVRDPSDRIPLLPASRYCALLAHQEGDDYRGNASRSRANSFSVLSTGESGTILNRHLLPPPPSAPTISQNIGEMTRGAQEAAFPTSSPSVASVSHLLPSNQFLATEEHGTAFTGYNDRGGDHERDQSFRGRPSTLQKSNSALALPPPCVEGTLPPLSERTVLPLGIAQDKEFCSEFHSFVRSELVEVFRANGEDVAERINNKRIVWHQVGIRCRFCAHVPRLQRVQRATTFPSSITRLHPSVSMMSREHFLNCLNVPDAVKSIFKTLQEEQNPSSPEKKSRIYWSQAATQLGLIDGADGIMFHTDAAPQGESLGTAMATPGWLEPRYQALVENDDRRLVSDYLYFLMSQAHRISLGDPDRRQHGQHSLPLGTSGFGCRHCSQLGVTVLKGQNRIFPVKLRQLANKINLLYEHLRQCELCPDDIKACMSLLKSSEERRDKSSDDQENEKKFLLRIFVRLHGNVPTGVPIDCHESTEINNLKN